MAVKLSDMFGALLLFFVLQPCVLKSLKLDSLENLEQVQKGGSANGLHQVKKYLKRYGYYPHGIKLTLDDSFDEPLESALKAYQQYLFLDVTGKVDSDTIKAMMTPRCALPDNQVSNYTITSRKWSRYHLTYYITNSPKGFTVDGVNSVFVRALNSWAEVSPFTFTKKDERDKSDIVLGFYSNDHGDYPFDGAFAHAFYPEDGRVHFNTYYNWTSNPTATDQADLESVGLHELGHSLGLDHSQERIAVMWPYYEQGTTKRNLTQDDKDGLKDMYDY